MRFDQKGALSYLIAFLAIIVLISGFLYFRKSINNPADISSPTTQVMKKTYTNSKYGFSVEYPETLAVREFPDTKDGVGFRPVNTPEDPVNEVITLSVLQRNADLANDLLSEYAKVAATVQIQNYQKLNTIEAVKTSGGAIGYKTTWDVLPMPILGASPSAQTQISLPITYFDLKETSLSSTVQITLENENYENEYTQIIDSYSVN